jgi:type IV secretion system protein TrbL
VAGGALSGCHWRRVATALGALTLGAILLASLASPASAQVLNEAQDFYRTTARTWLAPISAIARRLFVTLATLEVVVSGLMYALRRDSLDEVAAKFLFKFVILSFVLLLITGAGVWLAPLVNSFSAAGRAAGAIPVPVSPSEVMDLGIRIAFTNLDTSGLPLSIESAMAMLYFLAARIVVIVALTAVACLLVLAWLESYVALAGGVLFLGFGGFRATAQYAENYLNYLFYLGIRLFAMYLLLTAGTAIISTYIPPATVATSMEEQAVLTAICVIFAVLVLRIPGNMASRAASGGQFGIAQALRSL